MHRGRGNILPICGKLIHIISNIDERSINPDVAFEKRKKLDPLKSIILQPLWDVNFHGPSRLRDDGF